MATNQKGPGKSRSAPKPTLVSDDLEPISLKDELESEAVEPVEVESVQVESVEVEPIEVERFAAPPVEIESIDTIETKTVEPAPEPVLIEKAVAVAVVATTLPPPSAAPSGELDPGAWPLKTFDLFSENAAALFDLALALGKAESVSDALELQSRFVSERYSTLVRQAEEFAELTRRLTFEATAPVRLSISTFVA